MAKADIRILFRGGEQEGELMRFEPGSYLEGSVEVIPENEVRCNHLYVRLQWHTEGRGDRDDATAAEQDLFQGTLKTGMPNSYDFRLPLPLQPWSYAGHYVNIIWAVAVDVDVPWAINPRYSQPFILAPPRES